MDVTFIKDWTNPINGKTIKEGSVAGIHYKTAETLLEDGIVTITGLEAAKLKKVIPTSVDDFNPKQENEFEEF